MTAFFILVQIDNQSLLTHHQTIEVRLNRYLAY
jgi:hypothetical protein